MATDTPGQGRRRWPALLLGPLVSLTVLPLPTGLPPDAHHLAAILACVIVYWIAEPIPLPITALLGTAVCVLIGLAPVKTVFASYGHPIMFLFMGSFFLAEAMAIHGVDQKVAAWLIGLASIQGRPSRLLLAMGGATAMISMWISNTAATAMMLPIALGVLRARDRSGGQDPYRTGFMLMLSYSSTAGGMATVVGTPPNLIGAGLIADQTGVPISFFTWLMFGMPISVILLAAGWVLLGRLHPSARGTEAWPGIPRDDGRWTTGQVSACAAFGVAVVLWVGPGLIAAVSPATGRWLSLHLPNELVALLASGLLFVLPGDRDGRVPTLTWQQATQINWGIILLFGGSLAFGDLMLKTGLSDAMGHGFVEVFGFTSLWGLTAASIVVGVLLSELASNTAAASLIVPLAIGIAHAEGIAAVPPALGACLGASLGFALPVSTPSNAIIYGTTLVPMRSMIRAGLIFDLIGVLVIWLTLRIVCPLLGLS